MISGIVLARPSLRVVQVSPHPMWLAALGWRIILVVCMLCVPVWAGAASGIDEEAAMVFQNYASGVEALGIPPFEMSYRANLASIPSMPDLERRSRFFREMEARVWTVKQSSHDEGAAIGLAALSSEIAFQRDLTAQLQRFAGAASGAEIPDDGLFRLPDGRSWYRLYVRRWTSDDVSPDWLLAFGRTEVSRIQGELARLQRQFGYAGDDAGFQAFLNGPEFLITDEACLGTAVRAVQEAIRSRLAEQFAIVDVPAVSIASIPDATRETPPGYYRDGTFFYSFFGTRFPRRSLGWLFLHEAIPGHHYQQTLERRDEWERLKSLCCWFPGFVEGWGAYVENLGGELGIYDDPALELGKWEWDLVRSARVVIDVGIHHRGWSRALALDWWRRNVPGAAEVAEREVDRVTRWPGQALSYKVGEHRFLRLRKLVREQAGAAWDPRSFHETVLRHGSLPLNLFERVVLRGMPRQITR